MHGAKDADRKRVCLLSILYLRCERRLRLLPKLLQPLSPFNSLFEMRIGMINVTLCQLTYSLSILYLRCRTQECGTESGAATEQAFNSLFEMPRTLQDFLNSQPRFRFQFSI
jgi:hypothetical protein